MYLLVSYLVLSAYVPTTECACRTGFELLGEVISQSEKQLEVISSSHNCPACDTEFGCFNTLLDHFKMDLADLRTLQSSVIDSYLQSRCSFTGKTLYVGPDTSTPTQKVTSSNTDNLPFSGILGIDCNLRDNLLIHASVNTLEVIKTDEDGTNPDSIFDGPAQLPALLDSNSFFYVPLGGNIWRFTNGVGELVVTSPNANDIAVDQLEGAIYWANAPATNVLRASLDGENVGVLFTDTEQPAVIALESFTRRLYYVTANKKLKYYDLRDGTTGLIADLTDRISTSFPSDLSVCTNSIYLGYVGASGGWAEIDVNGTIIGPDTEPNYGPSTVFVTSCNLIP